MRLFHSESILNGAASEFVPPGIHRFVYVVFAGTNQAGQALSLANLNRFLLNKGGELAGTDLINTTVNFMSLLTNLKLGVAEFSSAVGGAFRIAVYLPFHAWWDLYRGTGFPDKQGYLQFDLSGVTGTIVASGTIKMYVEAARGLASYETYLIQRNIQIGGAGAVPQQLEKRNISSIFVIEDALIATYYVTTDRGSHTELVSQADQKSVSNALNRVETAIGLIEINLNPYNEITSDLNHWVKLAVDATGAVNLNVMLQIYLPLSQPITTKAMTPPPPATVSTVVKGVSVGPPAGYVPSVA